MARQEIAIHLQNVVRCLEFLMKHLGFWHNQTFELSCIYNENRNESIMKYIPANGGGNNKRSALLKPPLYPS